MSWKAYLAVLGFVAPLSLAFSADGKKPPKYESLPLDNNVSLNIPKPPASPQIEREIKSAAQADPLRQAIDHLDYQNVQRPNPPSALKSKEEFDKNLWITARPKPESPDLKRSKLPWEIQSQGEEMGSLSKSILSPEAVLPEQEWKLPSKTPETASPSVGAGGIFSARPLTVPLLTSSYEFSAPKPSKAPGTKPSTSPFTSTPDFDSARNADGLNSSVNNHSPSYPYSSVQAPKDSPFRSSAPQAASSTVPVNRPVLTAPIKKTVPLESPRATKPKEAEPTERWEKYFEEKKRGR